MYSTISRVNLKHKVCVLLFFTLRTKMKVVSANYFGTLVAIVGFIAFVNGQDQQQFLGQQQPQQQQQQQQQQPDLSQNFQPQPPSPPQQPAQQPDNNPADTLPAAADSIIGQLRPGFSCGNKVYGYYADVANDCRVFHVCWPITDEHGATLEKQWTFICGNQTLFNQERLVCDRPENVDCAQSEHYYSVNDAFGKIPGQQSQ